jgi:hypothetical protein
MNLHLLVATPKGPSAAPANALRGLLRQRGTTGPMEQRLKCALLRWQLRIICFPALGVRWARARLRGAAHGHVCLRHQDQRRSHGERFAHRTLNPLDGLILAGELDSVPLRTHWAILAMCNSGDESGGEGREAYSGLARSFLSAGAEAVTASRWEVDERATKVLISEVVREGILQGESPSRALALAMQKFRERAASSDDHDLANSPPMQDARRAAQPPRPYLHPYYWAGFVSIAR